MIKEKSVTNRIRIWVALTIIIFLVAIYCINKFERKLGFEERVALFLGASLILWSNLFFRCKSCGVPFFISRSKVFNLKRCNHCGADVELQ